MARMRFCQGLCPTTCFFIRLRYDFNSLTDNTPTKSAPDPVKTATHYRKPGRRCHRTVSNKQPFCRGSTGSHLGKTYGQAMAVTAVQITLIVRRMFLMFTDAATVITKPGAPKLITNHFLPIRSESNRAGRPLRYRLPEPVEGDRIADGYG